MQRPIDLAERVAVARVNGYIQLRNRRQCRQLVGVLRVADEEARDALRVEQGEELVDVRVEDRFADEA